MFGKGIYFADCPLKSWRYCFQSQDPRSWHALLAEVSGGDLQKFKIAKVEDG